MLSKTDFFCYGREYNEFIKVMWYKNTLLLMQTARKTEELHISKSNLS